MSRTAVRSLVAAFAALTLTLGLTGAVSTGAIEASGQGCCLKR